MVEKPPASTFSFGPGHTQLYWTDRVLVRYARPVPCPAYKGLEIVPTVSVTRTGCGPRLVGGHVNDVES